MRNFGFVRAYGDKHSEWSLRNVVIDGTKVVGDVYVRSILVKRNCVSQVTYSRTGIEVFVISLVYAGSNRKLSFRVPSNDA